MGVFDFPKVDADTWDRCDDLSHYYFCLSERERDERLDRSLRLFAVACLRGVQHLSTDDSCPRAVEVAERHADKPNLRALRSAGHAAERGYRRVSASGSVTDHSLRTMALLHAASQITSDKMWQGSIPAWFRVAGACSEVLRWNTERNPTGPCVRFFRDIFPNPFRPVAFDPAWRTATAAGLARTMYKSRDFGAMPILADVLEEAGCDSPDILTHCRGDGPHVRGCWVVDMVLGKA